MKRASIGVLMSLALILFTANSIWGSKDQPKSGNPFEGKILTVYCKGAQFGVGSIVKNASIEDIAGAKVLVGIVIGYNQDDVTEGVTTYIPWDNVASMYSMTPEQAAKAKEILDTKFIKTAPTDALFSQNPQQPDSVGKENGNLKVGETIVLDMGGKLFEQFVERVGTPIPPTPEGVPEHLAKRTVVLATVTHEFPDGKLFVWYRTEAPVDQKQRLVTVSGWVDPATFESEVHMMYQRPVVSSSSTEQFSVKAWIEEITPAKD